MGKLYFGKISSKHPQQFDRNFYGGGDKNSTWYGGMQPGDYVFPVFDQAVSKLWRVKGFSSEPNEINKDGSVQFEVIKTFDPVPISTVFARHRNFVTDISIVNRLTKSMAKSANGFFPLKLEKDSPPPEKMDFSEVRNIYIAPEQPFREPAYKDGDLRVTLDGIENMKIASIDVYHAGKFTQYKPLWSLYEDRSATERYNLNELLQFAIQDQADKKKAYLKSVVDEVKKNGFFTVGSPIGLYDNVLVGRKKTKRKGGVKDEPEDSPDVDEEVEEVDSAFEKYAHFAELLDSNPNLILYGPPGTGKTYSAQRIIEAFDNYRCDTKKTFREIKDEGRVEFITFHQSFSYEEFVEGLRPVIPAEEKSGDEGKALTYKIQEGILKQIANKADLGQIRSELKGNGFEGVREDSSIWKISLGRAGADDDIYRDCVKSGTIAINWLEDEDLSGIDAETIYKKLQNAGADDPKNDSNSIDNFINVMEVGDIVLVFASVTEIRAIGVLEGEYEYRGDERFPHRRKVRWLEEFKKPVNILKYNNGKRLTMKTVYPLWRFKFSDIKEILTVTKSDSPKKQAVQIEVPYFLVIDEINRGNISKIFGELITLIEKDKRNVLSCKLPYSQKDFKLPSNLYILGTMNTSDRSIAVLDVALRRRFYFKEIEPDAKIIEEQNTSSMQQELIRLFNCLNRRISEKLDRDHRIGHYHFLHVQTVDNLKFVWHYQIIPLLMEYFYNETKTLAQVIGNDFIDSVTGQVRWIKKEDEFMTAIRSIK